MTVSPYYQDATVTLYHGHALDVLRALPGESVDCVVTSPPYFGLRDYGVEGQLGLEESPAEYVAALVEVFAEVKRVLAADGTFWLNLGDSYSTRQRGSDEGWDKSRLSNPARVQKMQFAAMRRGRHIDFDREPKNLLGVPWRTAFALQDAGWILRNDVIWTKPNAMPESVADRLSSRHEHVFLFSKSRRYRFDLEAIKIPSTGDAPSSYSRSDALGIDKASRHRGGNPGSTLLEVHETRNPGDVWTIPTNPFPGAHFATFPAELPRRCILAGCKPDGTVLDPFHGSGTTGMVAQQLGRRYVGIDLNRNYLDLSLRTRLRNAALPFDLPEVSV